eukprot:g2721.t1
MLERTGRHSVLLLRNQDLAASIRAFAIGTCQRVRIHDSVKLTHSASVFLFHPLLVTENLQVEKNLIRITIGIPGLSAVGGTGMQCCYLAATFSAS